MIPEIYKTFTEDGATPEKDRVAPEPQIIIERPYGPPDETGKDGTETRESKDP